MGQSFQDNRNLIAALERMHALEDALRLFVDDENCRFDHHGYCQEHGGTKPCRNVVAWALLEE